MASHPPRFLVAGPVEPGNRVALDPAESKHARVRRLRKGETVTLFDGAGRSWLARVENAGVKQASLRVLETLRFRAGESSLDLTLAAAVLKKDRFDWLIEKATELGTTRFQPILTRFCLARPSGNRFGRWQQIALAAAKQCGRSMVPVIEPPAELGKVIGGEECRLLLCEGGGETNLAALAKRSPGLGKVKLVVGPEGGFAAEEIDAARSAGCLAVGLGTRILRSETAAIAAIALCQHFWGDLR